MYKVYSFIGKINKIDEKYQKIQITVFNELYCVLSIYHFHADNGQLQQIEIGTESSASEN